MNTNKNVDLKQGDEDLKNSLPHVSAEELRSYFLSPGDIYWCKKSGKNILLIRAGLPLDHDYLQKFTTLSIDYIANDKIIKEGIDLFKLFCSSLDEVEKIEARDNIIFWLKKNYWGRADSGTLDLSIVMQNIFYILPREVETILKSSSTDLYARNFKTAALGVCFALFYGYTDFSYLRDFYNIFFLFDLSLTEQNLSYHMVEALELEFKEAGRGVTYLDKFKDEKNKLLRHHSESKSIVVEKWSGLFQFESVLDLIDIHHESLNGKGFPYGLNFHELSDIEKVVLYVNSIVEKIEVHYKKNDGSEFFKYLLKYRGDDLRLAQIIEKTFELAQTAKPFHQQQVRKV